MVVCEVEQPPGIFCSSCVSCLVLRAEKQKFSESIDEMKALVYSSHNKAEEVITHAEEELALAKLIRRGAVAGPKNY